MKNILLKFDDERLEFLHDITARDEVSIQYTDRVNRALDRIPQLEQELKDVYQNLQKYEKAIDKKNTKLEKLKSLKKALTAVLN